MDVDIDGGQGSNDQPNEHIVPESAAGQRLDAYLAQLYPRFSRVQIRKAIDAQLVSVDHKRAKPSYKLNAQQVIQFESLDERPRGPQPEEIPLDILFEDDAVAVINKPSGMVVHPAKGHWSGTLTAALAHHFQELSGVGGDVRPGIVHRLDRDTTGAIIVAKTDPAHLALAQQFQDRTVEKEYVALVSPPPDRDQDWVDQPIGPHPYQREKMAIRAGHPQAREAQTFYRVEARWGRVGLVRAFPKTGRTHQIRVHLAHVGAPIIADRLYGGHKQFTMHDLCRSSNDGLLIDRQALHAAVLRIAHPVSGEPMEFQADLPADMQRVIEAAKQLNEK